MLVTSDLDPVKALASLTRQDNLLALCYVGKVSQCLYFNDSLYIQKTTKCNFL